MQGSSSQGTVAEALVSDSKSELASSRKEMGTHLFRLNSSELCEHLHLPSLVGSGFVSLTTELYNKGSEWERGLPIVW